MNSRVETGSCFCGAIAAELSSPEKFSPQAHAYWRTKLPWVEFLDNLPRIDTYSRERDESFGNPAER